MNEDRRCTVCGDVEELLAYAGSEGRHYALCRIRELDDVSRHTSNNWVYMLFIEDDMYPIVITEKCAKSILENPEEGATLAFNRWFDRYR